MVLDFIFIKETIDR